MAVCSKEVTIMATEARREGETPPPDSPEKRSVWTRWWMILIYAVAGVSASAVVSLVVVQVAGDEAAETFEDAATASAPEGYVLFDAAGAGFRVVHPADWVKGGLAERRRCAIFSTTTSPNMWRRNPTVLSSPPREEGIGPATLDLASRFDTATSIDESGRRPFKKQV